MRFRHVNPRLSASRSKRREPTSQAGHRRPGRDGHHPGRARDPRPSGQAVQDPGHEAEVSILQTQEHQSLRIDQPRLVKVLRAFDRPPS